ncbi:MAG: dihydrodipicolinate synthase family protein [Methylobacteriaceae bacterium]|nr:dihydrodipicolinate synthase family protein [Methylobacteriaceae bacterium]
MRKDGSINLQALARHARWTLEHGCDSVTLFGTTGEGASLSLRDRSAMLGAALGAGLDPARQLLAGVTATSLDDAADQASLAYDAGCRGILLMPPFYFKDVSDDGLFAWHASLFERLKGAARGVFLYHIPSQSATPISVSLIDRLRKAFPGVIAGVKDSSCDWPTQKAFLEAHSDIAVLVGDETQLARSVREGGEGSICGVANVAPGWLRPLVYEGKDDPRVHELVKAICAYPVMSAVKSLAAHLHGAGEEFATMRAPLPRLTEAQARTLAVAYDSLMKAQAA